ncbi:molybdopterin biosynthesis protein [Desulfobotulus sp. H1]|uniref:Molybdopterin molybdenumtransferase n=1 Tax=Desulfobotulus pelophilus TaxID=2823377 RepID=A0ABT3N6U5_9BACT|nr:molybdopterin biosynthesis protein [Desulfobotulus pelophilus]MCW7753164.1 molybdopterin biosynthesis protein [Desulfobotulus pelophilus]
MSQRNVYLSMIPLEQAREITLREFGSVTSKKEEIPSSQAVGRVLAEAVMAAASSPPHHVAAMDGYAIRAKETFHASESHPVFLKEMENAFPVNTGQVLPGDSDAVVMIEKVTQEEKGLRLEAPVFPWQHVRKIGEDIVATEMLFPATHEITPYCIGALLSGGVRSVPVFMQPGVLILPTGSELVSAERDPALLRPGEVIESNSHVLGRLAESCGGRWTAAPPIRDEVDLLASQLEEAALREDVDIILTVGGSSAGSHDFTRTALEKTGNVLFHGITMMPGKPVVLGKVCSKPVFGIPGYPVSAILAFEELVRPLIRSMLGRPVIHRKKCTVFLSRAIPSRLGLEEFVRIRLAEIAGRTIAAPLPRGAGCITSITEADAILRIPANSEGLATGAETTAELLRPIEEIHNTLLVVGSHDNALDLLANHLKPMGIRLSSAHVGSMGGLLAIRSQSCHMAGSHLLDPSDGSYNKNAIARILPETPVYRLHLAVRIQGFIVRKGNPMNIRRTADLLRPGLRFINRQPGSGTRILMDYELQKNTIFPGDIEGYDNEETTHMAVAAAVLSGSADAGLGIAAAARALDLDFVPLTPETYELIFPAELMQTPQIQAVIRILSTKTFRESLKALGGYTIENTGKLTGPERTPPEKT